MWELLRPLGKGTYAQVWYAKDPESGEECAIKRFSDSKECANEVKYLKLAKGSRHVVRMLGYSGLDIRLELKHSTLIIMPNADHLHIQHVMLQLLEGLRCLHSRGIVHCDIKPRNILWDEGSWTACLADLGMAAMIGDEVTAYTTTRWYRAPELCAQPDNKIIVHPSLDVWSIGCVFGELVCGRPLFPGRDKDSMFVHMARMLGTPPDHIMCMLQPDVQMAVRKVAYCKTPRNQAEQLLARMLDYDPAKRITVSDALRHPYFSS